MPKATLEGKSGGMKVHQMEPGTVFIFNGAPIMVGRDSTVNLTNGKQEQISWWMDYYVPYTGIVTLECK